MTEDLDFPVLLDMLDERSAAFRTAVASAPSLESQVPTCPEWTLLDLVQHLGDSHRRWGATAAAGAADAPPAAIAWAGAPPASGDRDDLVAWSARSTQQLLIALRAAGPGRGCWTWWDGSQSPSTCAAVARHQLQHVAVHTYDAEVTGGATTGLPDSAALDGVDEFLSTCVATTAACPHAPCTVDHHATDGPSWRLSLSTEGARARLLATATAALRGGARVDPPTADASLRGTASDLVLTLYGRVPVDSLDVEGDRRLFDLLLAWEPDA